jgi:hypothetical protein
LFLRLFENPQVIFEGRELVRRSRRHISRLAGISGGITMFKIAVIAFALVISGFMVWVGNHDAKFAQGSHATFVKRAV